MTRPIWRAISLAALALAIAARPAHAQPASPEDARAINDAVGALHGAIAQLRRDPRAENFLPDVEVYAKAAEWIARHKEFFKPEFAAHTQAALKAGLARAAELSSGPAKWDQAPGRR